MPTPRPSRRPDSEAKRPRAQVETRGERGARKLAMARVLSDGPFMASKGRPYRTVQIEGYEVLIGKGAEENDVLSLQVAAPQDLWLHVAGGVPGSHVVIRNPEKQPIPKHVVEQAAAHAAWYSKARGAPRVEVHTCLAKDVSKPKGAPPGRVHIRHFTAIKVSPKPVETGDSQDSSE